MASSALDLRLWRKLALFVKGRVERGKHVVEAAGNRLLAYPEALIEIARPGDQRLVELTGAFVQGGVELLGIGVERRGTGFELAEQLLATLRQVIAECIETRVEFVAERHSGGRQARKQRVGPGGQHGAQIFERMVRFVGKCRGPGIDERSEGLAGDGDARRNVLACRFEVVLQLGMRASDRRADPIRMADDRFAFETKLLDERADTQFVFAVAAFECADFRMHERFELGCPGDGALYALVHRRDFAAHGLADRHDAVGGIGFRLGEAHRNLGHRTRGAAQFLSTRDHDREGEEEHDGQGDAEQDADCSRHGREIAERADLPDPGRIKKVGDAKPGNRPDQ